MDQGDTIMVTCMFLHYPFKYLKGLMVKNYQKPSNSEKSEGFLKDHWNTPNLLFDIKGLVLMETANIIDRRLYPINNSP